MMLCSRVVACSYGKPSALYLPRTEHEPVHDWFMNRFAGYGSVCALGSGSHGSPVFTVRPVLARTGSRFALPVRFAAFMR